MCGISQTMAGFREFPDLIEYYTTMRNGTIPKDESTTIENHTLILDVHYFENLPNQNSQRTLPTKSYTC